MTLDVYWNPVTQEDRNGIILGYSVLLFDALGVFLRNATVMNSTQLYYQFEHLEAWTNYSVKVNAFTSKGAGPVGSSIFVQTGEDGMLHYHHIINQYYVRRGQSIFLTNHNTMNREFIVRVHCMTSMTSST